jgi:exopolysaccharide production protein ExoY
MFRTDVGSGAGLAPTGRLATFPRPPKKYQLAAKRGLDIIGAVLFVLCALPLLLFVCAGVVLTSGLPLIYVHQRAGKEGRLFSVYKFRTMRRDADQVLTELLARSPEAREEWRQFRKLRVDPRITRFGKFLRASSLDELPQLWNVIKGDMSLVGPRPVTFSEQQHYGSQWSAYCAMRPGITGMWQVNGRNSLTYPERVAYDMAYVANWSVWMDIRILSKTVLVVLRQSGSM